MKPVGARSVAPAPAGAWQAMRSFLTRRQPAQLNAPLIERNMVSLIKSVTVSRDFLMWQDRYLLSDWSRSMWSRFRPMHWFIAAKLLSEGASGFDKSNAPLKSVVRRIKSRLHWRRSRSRQKVAVNFLSPARATESRTTTLSRATKSIDGDILSTSTSTSTSVWTRLQASEIIFSSTCNDYLSKLICFIILFIFLHIHLSIIQISSQHSVDDTITMTASRCIIPLTY